MAKREYYSIRTGKHPDGKAYSLEVLNRLVKDIYLDFRRQGHFDEYFGFRCVDSGENIGKLGADIGAKVFRALKKENIYPFVDNFSNYSEDDLFDVIEFLFDHVSEPLDGDYHSWGDCGMHLKTFDKSKGENILELPFMKFLLIILMDLP